MFIYLTSPIIQMSFVFIQKKRQDDIQRDDVICSARLVLRLKKQQVGPDDGPMTEEEY